MMFINVLGKKTRLGKWNLLFQWNELILVRSHT